MPPKVYELMLEFPFYEQKAEIPIGARGITTVSTPTPRGSFS
jgi:hypothetical protein